MYRRPPRSSRPSTLFPYTSLCRSGRSCRRDRAERGACRRDEPQEEGRAEAARSIDVAGGCGPLGLDRIEGHGGGRSEEHTSELQSLMRISYAVFCLKKTTSNYLIQYRTNNNNQTEKTYH